MPIVITIPDSRLTGFSEPAKEQAHASVQDYVDALMSEIDHYEQIKRLPASGRPEKDAAIATQPYGPPLYLRPIDYWKLEDEFGHLREKDPDTYWPPEQLQYDKNPLIKLAAKTT